MTRRSMLQGLAALPALALAKCAGLKRIKHDVLGPLCAVYSTGFHWVIGEPGNPSPVAAALDLLAQGNQVIAAAWYQIKLSLTVADPGIRAVCAMDAAEETRARVALATGAALVAEAAQLYGDHVAGPHPLFGEPEWQRVHGQMLALQAELAR